MVLNTAMPELCNEQILESAVCNGGAVVSTGALQQKGPRFGHQVDQGYLSEWNFS